MMGFLVKDFLHTHLCQVAVCFGIEIVIILGGFSREVLEAG